MKKRRKLLGILLILSALVLQTGCAKTTETNDAQTETAVLETASASTDNSLQNVIDRDKLIVGVRYDVPSFGYENPDTGNLEGVEIELVKKFAKELLGDENKVEYVMVTAKTRGALMDSGQIDCCIATMTTTEERLASYAASDPYFTDIGAIMVKKDAGIGMFADMEGKTIGAPQGTTSTKDVQAYAEKAGVKIKTAEFPTIADCKAALVSGRVDGIVNDTAILNGYMDENTILLDERFVKQQYRVWSKLGNDAIIQAADKWIDSLQESGELETMLAEWKLQDFSDYEEQ